MPITEREINNQKVYTKATASGTWVEDKTLFWDGGQSAKGTSRRSFASIIPITPDGKNEGADPTEQAEIDEAKLRMQYGLDEYLGITDLDASGMPKGKWILVTKLNSLGVETPRFIGQAWTVTRNFSNDELSNAATAIGLDGILSTYPYVGATHIDTDGNATHFDDAPAIFNERDRPNRSDNKNSVGGDQTYIFDYENPIFPDNVYWEPQDAAEYTLNRLKNQVYATTTDKVYPFYGDITNNQLTLDGPNPFGSQTKLREYDPNKASIWTVITQMVEAGGDFTTTISYTGTGTNSYARITVV